MREEHLPPEKSTDPNSRAALLERRAAGVLTWRGPALMVFARSVFAVAAQGAVAAVYATQGSAAPWRDAGAWLPVYGTVVDACCLCALWWLARREGITLLDIVGFDRRRLGRDVVLGFALIPPSLAFIFCGIALSSLFVYGNLDAPQINQPLPLLPALYAVLVWPLIWGMTEQMTYNGYLVPRLQVLSGTGFAVALVAFSWSFQHVVMPLTFDADFMTHRLLSPIPNTLFFILVYLRTRRLVPLVIAHWLMDGTAAFVDTLWPVLP